jgi:hypothetical protein
VEGEHAVSYSQQDAEISLRVAKAHTSLISPSNLYASHDHDTPNDTSASVFADDSTWDDGWVVGRHSELLFWVPHRNRAGLWWPSNSAVWAELTTKLDLSQFLHGTCWEQCKS